MKKKFSIHPNTLLMLCILGVTLIVNTIGIFVNNAPGTPLQISTQENAALLLTVLDLLKIALIAAMAILVFFLIKKSFRNRQWDDTSYRPIKRIGWLSVLVLLLDAITTVAREQYSDKNISPQDLLADPGRYPGILAQALFSTPIVAWFLVCVIFLLADLLQYAGNMKKEEPGTG